MRISRVYFVNLSVLTEDTLQLFKNIYFLCKGTNEFIKICTETKNNIKYIFLWSEHTNSNNIKIIYYLHLLNIKYLNYNNHFMWGGVMTTPRTPNPHWRRGTIKQISPIFLLPIQTRYFGMVLLCIIKQSFHIVYYFHEWKYTFNWNLI
jgi:hypothetical protein